KSTVTEPPEPTEETVVAAEAESTASETVELVAEAAQPDVAATEEPIFVESPQPVETTDVTAEQTETVETQQPVETSEPPVEVTATNETEAPVAETPTTTEPEIVHEAQTPEETAPTPSSGVT